MKTTAVVALLASFSAVQAMPTNGTAHVQRAVSSNSTVLERAANYIMGSFDRRMNQNHTFFRRETAVPVKVTMRSNETAANMERRSVMNDTAPRMEWMAVDPTAEEERYVPVNHTRLRRRSAADGTAASRMEWSAVNATNYKRHVEAAPNKTRRAVNETAPRMEWMAVNATEMERRSAMNGTLADRDTADAVA